MKPAGFLLLLPAGLLGVASAAEPAAGLVSREAKAHVLAGLPKFDAAAKSAEVKEQESAVVVTPSGPDVLVLPKMTIKERRLPTDADDHLMKRSDFKRKMENLYLDEVAKDGELNYLLNSFTIPILSPSKAARGQAIQRRREYQRLSEVGAATRSLDAQGAAKIQDEIDRATREPPPLAVIK